MENENSGTLVVEVTKQRSNEATKQMKTNEETNEQRNKPCYTNRVWYCVM